MTKLFERLATYRTPVTLTGDINIHFERTEDADACRITEIFTSFGLQQFVDLPTHERGGILDVIVAPYDEPPTDVVVEDVDLSDHMLVSWTVNLTPPLPVYVTTTRRSWKTFKKEDFFDRLRSSALGIPGDPDMDLDQLAAQYSNIITELLDSTAPLKTMHLRERPRKA